MPAVKSQPKRNKTKQVRRSQRVAARRNGKVARWGNSLAVRIPQDIADDLQLREGGQVSLEMRTGAITIRPLRRTWTEADLLKGVTPDLVGGEVDSGRPVGKEIW